MKCGSCGSTEEKNKDQYKCESCGSVSEKQENCCGKPREKLCDCGSGKPAKSCC